MLSVDGLGLDGISVSLIWVFHGCVDCSVHDCFVFMFTELILCAICRWDLQVVSCVALFGVVVIMRSRGLAACVILDWLFPVWFRHWFENKTVDVYLDRL